MKNKVLTALLSVAIAFGLWAYVMMVVSPESESTYYNVPVVLGGQSALEERDLMIISKKEFTVDLTLSGNRTDLNKLSNGNITLVADLSRITEAGTHSLHYTVSFPGVTQSGTIHTVKQDPQLIEITVVERSKKDIPVKVTYTGTLPDGYTADRQNVVLDHSTVTVSGPKHVIEQIEQAKITVDLNNRNQTINGIYRHTLCDENGEPIADVSDVTVNVSDIQATIPISRIKEIPLRLNIIPGGGVNESNAVITLDRTSITVSGSEAALKDLDELVLGTIDLGKIMESTSLTFDIALPNGVMNVTGVTTVDVQIDLPEMTVRNYTASIFETVNVPAGVAVSLQTEQLIVKIRGPEGQLDLLQPENIVVVVDCSDAQPGSGTYPVTVQIRGMDGVGAVGEYTVIADVRLRLADTEE